MFRIDPRCKLYILLTTVLFSIIVKTGPWTVIWMIIITLFGLLSKQYKKSIKGFLLFSLMWIFSVFFLDKLSGTLHTSLLVWFGLVFKCYPTCMISSIIVSSTKISEFMASMAKMRVPKELFIPLAIMFRYFPVVKEDFGHIKDAMALRGINLSLSCFIKNPSEVIDALYVPILVAASKTIDELTVASVTRGIENPRRRTSRISITFSLYDYVFASLFTCLLIISIIVKV